ncbi:MAG: hypothetical protein KKH74_06455 [Gammaproteobacteria bacterium]|nr:hypothetical protein [Gammaproteobacteria bacterium]MBU1732284.1 hypothetical protein [Gammaproteobacteria bacterium]MBU1893854.1 hypothetical protein [Gammaproteobacteria bacterium]
MSIASDAKRKAGPFNGNGGTTAFPFSFKVFQASDLLVVRTDTTGAESELQLTTDYSVAFNANQETTPGGTVNLTVAPPSGYLLTIGSRVPALQPVVLSNSGGFYPTVLNDALDRAVILIQQLSEQLSRAVKVPVSSSINPDTLLDALGSITVSPSSSTINGPLLFLDNVISTSMSVPVGKNALGIQPTIPAGVTITIPAGSQLITLDNLVGGSGSGEANTASNLGTGQGVYASKSGVNLNFKSLVAGTNVTLSSDASAITINAEGGSGEINTASNLGAGQGLFTAKSGVNLPFKSLVAGTNVTLSATSDAITINATGGGGGDAYLANTQNFTGVNTFSNQVNIALSSTQRIKAQRGQLYDLSSGSRIGFEYQHVDTGTGGNNEQIYNATFMFRSTGAGTIGTFDGKPQSLSFWYGLYSNMEKWGSGSGHAFTANVTLMNTSGYAEGGGFQGSVSNIAAAGHYLSLFEGIVNDGGFDTNMNCAALRVQKNATTSNNPTNAILISGEGTGTIDRILALNPSAGATNLFNTGIDLSRAHFATGVAMVMPNNSNLAWVNNAAAVKPILYLAADNLFRIQYPGVGTYEGVAVVDSAGAFQFTSDNYGGAGGDHVSMYVGGQLRRVGVGALNSGGSGFRQLIVPN